MKLKIGNYDVEIEATNKGSKWTLGFLNGISLAFFRASERADEQGCTYTAKEYVKMASDIHDYLDKEWNFYNIYRMGEDNDVK